MQYKIFFLTLLMCYFYGNKSHAQTQDSDTTAPIIIPYAPTAGLSALANDDFSVQVRLKNKSNWVELYEYLTYVNSSSSDNLKDSSTKSSFVNFDFEGEIVVKVTCNYCAKKGLPISSKTTLIRPLSRKIEYTIDNKAKSIEFTLTKPENLSIEINGDRYRNMHLFSNIPDPGPPGNPDDYTSVDEMMAALQKNKGRKNDFDKVWYYAKKDNEVIYIGGNEVFRGGIRIDGKNNVTIRGRGIIDHQGMDKNFSNKNFPDGYDFLKCIKIKNTTGTTVDGIILNDAQQNPIHSDGNKNLTIKSLKSISQVKWGGSIYISSANGVTVDNCFLRSSDDCIPITPIFNGTTGQTKNVTIKNTSLYADVAHPIVLGWVGSNKAKRKGVIDNVLFENIDILEHDEGMEYYQGAIAIHCGEENNCQNITFRNIRIEDFSNGSLLNLIVEPKWGNLVSTDGYRVQNITFDSIVYNGSGEKRSKILGLNNCRYVSGVHFNNVWINNKRIDNLKDYKIGSKNGFKTNKYIYDITFNSPIVKTSIPSGTFYIKNQQSKTYLSSSPESFLKTKSKNHTVSELEKQGWDISPTEDGFYTIKSTSDGRYLTSTKLSLPENSCSGDHVITAPADESLNNQKWKFVQSKSGSFRIINANGGNSSLKVTTTKSKLSRKNTYVGTGPWTETSDLVWSLIRID